MQFCRLILIFLGTIDPPALSKAGVQSSMDGDAVSDVVGDGFKLPLAAGKEEITYDFPGAKIEAASKGRGFPVEPGKTFSVPAFFLKQIIYGIVVRMLDLRFRYELEPRIKHVAAGCPDGIFGITVVIERVPLP